jgi:hypothetical protein
MTPGTGDQPAGAQPADPDREARLGIRRSFWGRMRNRFGLVRTATRHANEDPRSIGVQGENHAWGNDSFL